MTMNPDVDRSRTWRGGPHRGHGDCVFSAGALQRHWQDFGSAIRIDADGDQLLVATD